MAAGLVCVSLPALVGNTFDKLRVNRVLIEVWLMWLNFCASPEFTPFLLSRKKSAFVPPEASFRSSLSLSKDDTQEVSCWSFVGWMPQERAAVKARSRCSLPSKAGYSCPLSSILYLAKPPSGFHPTRTDPDGIKSRIYFMKR